jgi:SAM-dependent methyltransferase
VLMDMAQVRKSVARVQAIGLPLVDDLPKNWDCLAALDVIRRHVPVRGRIFDAGGETYSMILPWLYYYGYRHLTAGNLVYDRPIRRASIRYQHADITRTDFAPESFDAITCLSVIEHGVDLPAYFKEMARLLVPGGYLVTSTDYFDAPTDCRGQRAYGAPIRVFDRAEIEAAIELARSHGLELTGPLDLTAKDRVVHWREFDLRYTFMVFTLRKIKP